MANHALALMAIITLTLVVTAMPAPLDLQDLQDMIGTEGPEGESEFPKGVRDANAEQEKISQVMIF